MSEATGRIVCFGELLLRLSAVNQGALLQYSSLDANFGGAEANVAVALARLGTPSAMVSAVPPGALGDAAIEHLRRHGVDASPVVRAPGRLGLYFLTPGAAHRASAVIYDRKPSAFAALDAGAFDWDALLDGAAWFHLSGITAALGPGAAALATEAARAARARGLRVSFDINYRAQLWSESGGDAAAILSAIIAQADLLFANHRDAALLLERPFAGDDAPARRAAAEALLAAFPNLRWIASTMRAVIDGTTHRLAARLDTRAGGSETASVLLSGIVDRIGGGDAFAAGILHSLAADRPSEAAETALALAVLKHYTPGDASYATPDDIARYLSSDREVQR